jgi:glycerophosphoryl diester phosphodiesterase
MIRRLAATLPIVIVFLTVPAPASAAACVNIPAVAHRGGTERYVENTLNAFRDAGNRGVLSWETDVRFTADDVPVLLHDDTLDRTTDAAGPVADVTAPVLAAARTADAQAVPTLGELVNDAAVDGARLFLELKTNPTPAQWAAVLAAVDSRSMRAKIVLMAFDPAVVLEAQAAAPSVETALIENPGYRPVAELTPYGGSYVKHQWSVTAARLDEWSGPLDVYAWTVDTAEDWERMHYYAAEPGRLDGVITNRPAAYRAWQKARVC